MGIKAMRQGLDGVNGDTNVKYSRDHTTDNNGDLTVTFPVGLFSAPPIVIPSVISSAAGDQYTVELVGVPTATNAVIKVRRFVGLTLNILSLGIVNLFLNPPGVTTVHVVAMTSA